MAARPIFKPTFDKNGFLGEFISCPFCKHQTKYRMTEKGMTGKLLMSRSEMHDLDHTNPALRKCDHCSGLQTDLASTIQHELFQCPVRPVNCPNPACKWRGPVSIFDKHWKNECRQVKAHLGCEFRGSYGEAKAHAEVHNQIRKLKRKFDDLDGKVATHVVSPEVGYNSLIAHIGESIDSFTDAMPGSLVSEEYDNLETDDDDEESWDDEEDEDPSA